jgi:hypothetical protein
LGVNVAAGATLPCLPAGCHVYPQDEE